jgi:hypothetical protein
MAQVIVFDHNGQGLSRDLAPRLPLSISSMATDIMEFISRLNLREKPNVLVSSGTAEI